MTFRAEVLTPKLDVAPGDVVVGRIQITNDGQSPGQFTIELVGLDDSRSGRATESLTLAIDAGEVGICEIPVRVPHAIGSGEHAAAFQVVSSQQASRPTLAGFTLSVSSLAGLEMTASPTPVRGRRRASFHIDVINNEAEPAAFTLVGEATDVQLKFSRPSFDLAAGQRDSTPVRVRARRLWRGEPIQHNLLVTAQGRASTATTTVPYVQRPVFAHTSRAFAAALLLIALWAGALVGVFALLQNRADQQARDADAAAAAASITGVDTDGDGVADVFYDATGLAVVPPEEVDLDGDGVPDGHVDGTGRAVTVVTAVDTDGDGFAEQFVDADGAIVRNPSTGSGTAGGAGGDDDGGGNGPDQIASSVTPATIANGSDVRPASVRLGPTSTSFGGTVTAAGGDVDVTDTLIVVRPITLNGDSAPTPDVVAFAGERAGVPTKIWSARRTAPLRSESGVRQTEPVIALQAAPDANGIWRVGDIDLFRSYEVTFAKAGFDTQSFVLTPPDDGEPVELDVELQPASGAIRGRIIGPNGPIGGADVRITDGTLVFETTAATSGDVGAFILERVSTPGVYTLSVTLRGFGTEVVQVQLGAGEQRTGVDIAISPGVGTVSGRIVDEAGRALPGAAVSASNGDTTRSTSSLTDGDVGFYSIPQLDVSTPQTINVVLAGYTTQTRRIPGGSAAGVNFVMVRTTSTISGQVDSSGGGGIVAAGVTLTNGELEFRASTTNAPAGFFAVDDLPPGNYTVTLEHFEHESATEFVVVTEGADPAPLAITLPALERQPTVGTGELVVDAIDLFAESADERSRPITLELVETRTGNIIEETTTPERTPRITGIPPGTYTLTVFAEGFADSTPLQVSIGLQSERREIELQRKGSAGGRMVDSLTGDPVGPFVLELFRVIGNDVASVGTVAGAADGTWQTPNTALLDPGEYRVGIPVVGAPRGYRVLEDQLIDADAGGLMRFTVDPLELDTNVVLDIEADPFPDIEGRVFTPRLVAATVTELDPIDSGSLQAVLRCNGNPNEISATMTDVAGGGTTPTPLFDSFSITKEEVDDAGLIGDCRVDLTADTYVAASIPLPELAPSNGILDNDRITNAAMYAPVDTIGGTVFWVDDRVGAAAPVFLDAVDIATNAVVSFPPEDAPPPPPGQQPDVVRGDLSTSSVNGAWALSGQVFGPANYRVNEEGFAPTSFDVVIDESRDRVVTAAADITMTPTSPSTTPVGANTQFELELNAPFDGAVNGRVSILTSDLGNEEFANVGIEAFQPLGRTQVPTSRVERPAVDDGTFAVNGASAGTWDVEFTLPPNHILHIPANASTVASERVDPGETQAGFDTTLVDLATINVRATDPGPANNPVDSVITSEMDVALRPDGGGGAAQDPPVGNAPELITGVIVDVANPVTTEVSYLLDVSLRGFDPFTAEVFAGGNLVASGRLTDIPVSVVAGRDLDVEVRIRPFGSIIGTIDGAIEPPNLLPVEPLEVTSPNGAGRATITVTAVDVNGIADTSAEGTARAAAVLVEPTGTAGQFRAQGPAGFYRFVVEHPEFVSPPIQSPTDGLVRPGATPLDPVITLPPDVFELRGETENTLVGGYVLELRTSSLRLVVVDDLVSNVGLTSFNYELTPQFGPAPITPLVGTAVASPFTIPGLTPGMYSLRIDDGSNRFPFLANVMVRRSDAAATKTTIVTAPLPIAGATIAGNVAARNSAGALVPLPSVDLRRTYLADVSGVIGDDQQGADQPIGNATVAEQTVSVASASGTAPYAFTDAVAAGFHTLSLTDSPGYTAPAAAQVEVEQTNGLAVDPTVPELTLTVLDVTATVQINAVPNGEFTNLTVELFDPGVVPAGTGRPASGVTGPSNARTATFTAIPPDIRPYTLRITDPLYGTQDFAILVGVDVDGDGDGDATPGGVDPVVVAPIGALGRLTGTLTQFDGIQRAPLDQTATVTLTAVAAPGAPAVTPITTGTDGIYSVDVVDGTYTLEIEERPNDGFSGATAGVTVVAGAITPQDLEVLDLAQVDVNILNAADMPAGTIVQLESQATGTRSDPTTGLTFFVAPGQYRIVVSGAYPETFFPAGNGFFAVNATGVSRTITLPRRVTVNIVNPPAGLEVRVDGAVDDSAPYEFSSPAINASGALSVEYLYDSADVAVAGGQTPGTLVSTVAATFTTLTGDLITSPASVVVPDGTAVTATSGSVTLTGEVGAGNTYSIEGLVPNNPGARTWAIEVDHVGSGIGTATVNVTPNIGASTVENLVVQPQTFDLAFEITSLGEPVIDASVTLDGVTLTGTSPITFTGISETAGSLDYTVGDTTGTLSQVATTQYVVTDRVDDQVPIVLTQLQLTGEVTGTTVDDTIQVCEGAAPAVLAGACVQVRGPTSGAAGQVAFNYAPITNADTYHLLVTVPGPAPVAPAVQTFEYSTLDFEVRADGSVVAGNAADPDNTGVVIQLFP